MRSYLSTIRMEKQGRAQVSSMEIMRWEQRHIACMTVDMAARLQRSKLFFRIRRLLLMAANCAIRPNGARVLPPKQQEITLPTGTASQGYFGPYRDGAKAGDVCSISGYRAGENYARISRGKTRKVGRYDLEAVFIIRGCRMGDGFCCPARRKNADNTLCIARFFNAAGRQKTRSDGVEWL